MCVLAGVRLEACVERALSSDSFSQKRGWCVGRGGQQGERARLQCVPASGLETALTGKIEDTALPDTSTSGVLVLARLCWGGLRLSLEPWSGRSAEGDPDQSNPDPVGWGAVLCSGRDGLGVEF